MIRLGHCSLAPLQRSTTVSVIIPAYNAGRFIEDAIASVLAQDLPANEIVVVNDGSNDRDYSRLERLHKTLKVIDQENRGVSAARNAGCAAATGLYVALLDADDVWLPGKLRAQVQHLSREPAIAAVFCRGHVWTPAVDGASWPRPVIPAESHTSDPRVIHLRYPDFLCSIPVAPSTMVIRRSVWLEIGGFNENLRYGEDHDFYLRLSHQSMVDLLDIQGMLYRRHPQSATAVVQDQNHLADVVLRAAEELGTTDTFGNRVDPQLFATYLSRIHFQHGYEHFCSGSFRIARREFSLAVKGKRAGLRTWAYLLLSQAPGFRVVVRNVRRALPHRESTTNEAQST